MTINSTSSVWEVAKVMQYIHPSLHAQRDDNVAIWSLFYLFGFVFGCLAIARAARGRWVRLRAPSADGPRTVSMLPSWFPFLGHLPELILRPDTLLKGNRDKPGLDIFSLNLGGSVHNIIWAPHMAQTVFAQRNSVVDFESLLWFFVHQVSGVPAHFKETYDFAYPGLNAAVHSRMMREPQLSTMIGITMTNIEHTMPNLLSFSKSVVDQSEWERASGARLVSGPGEEPVMEVSLLPLLLNYIAHQAIPSVFGSDLLRNSPNLLPNLWDYNAGLLLLAAGLPRWLPIPLLRRSIRGRNAVNDALAEQQRAMDAQSEGRDPGPQWQNLDDISLLIKERHKVFREFAIPPSARADLPILWATNANSNFLVFWILLHIFLTPGLVERLRDETAPYVKVTASKDFAGASEPPTIKLDEKGLATSCPLLKSCFIESLRLDNAPWSLKKVMKDFVLPNRSAGATGTPGESHLLKAGSYVDVAFDLHFTDPVFFPQPDLWIPDRHIVNGVAEWGTVRPFGGGTTMCKGRLFAEKEVLAILASILAMWDFEPAEEEKGWKIPKGGKATGVKMPKGDVRVKIKRRKMGDS